MQTIRLVIALLGLFAIALYFWSRYRRKKWINDNRSPRAARKQALELWEAGGAVGAVMLALAMLALILTLPAH